MSDHPWAGARAVQPFQAMATYELRSCSKPKTAGLAPIFAVVGSRFSSGSRLIPTLATQWWRFS